MSLDINIEISKLLRAEQHDPFMVLGFHILAHDPAHAVIRTFQPHAESVRLVMGSEKKFMYKMRDEGLFELIVPYSEPFEYFFEIMTFRKDNKVQHDPYRFLPQLSEFDQHLFNNGTHYELYNKLGSQLTTIDGIPGTLFSVWAPGASRASVIGDFNYWDGRVHQMRSIHKSGVWELFIPGISQGEPYKFELRTANGDILEKTDPFHFFAEIRPKSASVVWNLDGFDWHDEAWLQQRDAAAPYDRPMAIYEVHPGSWQRDPADPARFLTFRELAHSLIPYVKKMGFTHIELLPIMEHPLDESWGYQVTGYFAVTSRYGTPDDFMYFVDCCHQSNIGVLLDWVPSHFVRDGHSLGRFDGTALYEHEDPRQGSHSEWGTLIFNYGRKEVANFLLACALFWMDKYHIDGLRTDAVAAMLYLDYGRQNGEWVPNPYGGVENLEAIEFLRHLNSIVYQRHPGVLMIAEESTSFYGVSKPTEQGGLGFGFKWNMGWMNDMLNYFSRDPFFRKHHHNSLTFSLLYAFSENFILPISHDEVVHGKKSLLAKMPGDRWQQFANLRLLLFFLWTHPGKKLLFMGSEFGQLSEWYCKVSLDWHLLDEDEKHRKVQYFVEVLNHFYQGNPALYEMDFSHEGFRWMDFRDTDNSIIAYARLAKDKRDHLICLLNFTPQVLHHYKLGVLAPVPYREVLCSDLNEFGGSNIYNPGLREPVLEPFAEAPYHVTVSVPPLAGIILKPEY